MKKLKMVLVLALAVSMTAMLAACGSGNGGSSGGNDGGDAAADTTADVDENGVHYGLYTAVAAEMMGITMGMDEVYEDGGTMTLELKENNKLVLEADGSTGKGSYSVEGDQITISVQGEDMVGTFTDNSITIDDMLGMGLTMYFGLEGTDAMDPAYFNVASEDEQQYVGTWVSTSVTDVLGDPVDIADDALVLNFAEDHTVTGSFDGTEFGPFEWDTVIGLDITNDDPSFLIMENDDGTLAVDISSESGDYYYSTVMSKQ